MRIRVFSWVTNEKIWLGKSRLTQESQGEYRLNRGHLDWERLGKTRVSRAVNTAERQ
jgi:hypothetical protein